MVEEAAHAREALAAWTAKTRPQKESVFGAERLDKRGRG